MIRPEPQSAWPESWKLSHIYDMLELEPASNDVPGYTWAYRSRRDEAMALLQRACPPPAKIIDIAAAQGNMSLYLAEAGYEVYWNDLRGELFQYVLQKHERGIIRPLPGNIVDVHHHEAFDCALVAEVIEHTAHPDEFLSAVARLIRPGGHIVLTTPNGAYMLNKLPKFSDCKDPSAFEDRQFGPNSDDHIFLLHSEEIHTLASKAGLRVCSLGLITNPLTNGHLKLSSLLRCLPAFGIQFLERLGRRFPGFIKKRIHTCLVAHLEKPL
jgi:2-polyprenyl-3-methyl-5-hydroxy-6-metoxy-1,4-benzoquinol methylase